VSTSRSADEVCWDASAEREPWALEESEVEYLRQTVTKAADGSGFYRGKLTRAGLDPVAIRELADVSLLPFTDKGELRASQEQAPPLGEHQVASFDDIVRLQATSGTSGTPFLLPFTRQDLWSTYELGARCMWCAGARPQDLVLECLGYSLYVGGMTDHLCFEHAGCCVLPYGPGQTERLIATMRQLVRPMLLYSTPAYPQRLAEVAAAAGIDPGELNLTKAILSGEGGLTAAGYRKTIEDTWGCTARGVYGTAELGCIAAECDALDGMHVLTAGHVLVELVDPVQGTSIPLTKGAVGELVLTTLQRTAAMFIRYRTHDIAEVVSTDPCACTRGGPRIQIRGRSDDMFIVRGVNVHPMAVLDVISRFRPDVNGEFQIRLHQPPPMDVPPSIVVEAVTSAGSDALADAIRAELKAVLNLTVAVEVQPLGTLPRPEGKTQRVVKTYREDTE
jgi:phenylacetate-CoA ligase